MSRIVIARKPPRRRRRKPAQAVQIVAVVVHAKLPSKRRRASEIIDPEIEARVAEWFARNIVRPDVGINCQCVCISNAASTSPSNPVGGTPTVCCQLTMAVLVPVPYMPSGVLDAGRYPSACSFACKATCCSSGRIASARPAPDNRAIQTLRCARVLTDQARFDR